MAPFWSKKSKAPTHAVITHLPWEPDGSDNSLDPVFALEDRFETALQAIGAEHDGNEVGGGEVVFYAYGLDADAMLEAITGCFKDFPVNAGAFAIKRYGEAGDPSATQTRVDF